MKTFLLYSPAQAEEYIYTNTIDNYRDICINIYIIKKDYYYANT